MAVFFCEPCKVTLIIAVAIVWPETHHQRGCCSKADCQAFYRKEKCTNCKRMINPSER
ncbi:hypothetical protein Plim_3587 [Planctopirus limnophila DSM 3776]|uniref:Uncharacterized protein n=1 Tax=Planctopirus limnophila (strain ATCC 43296 / DSM 3776 / IFAM 1008 / Mu 290) TaxID=521674 RepID=D5SVP0_PLAL2|nr:hypothetical protein Plim_3587 [Planctopirus limnophila DSM 3776]